MLFKPFCLLSLGLACALSAQAQGGGGKTIVKHTLKRTVSAEQKQALNELMNALRTGASARASATAEAAAQRSLRQNTAKTLYANIAGNTLYEYQVGVIPKISNYWRLNLDLLHLAHFGFYDSRYMIPAAIGYIMIDEQIRISERLFILQDIRPKIRENSTAADRAAFVQPGTVTRFFLQTRAALDPQEQVVCDFIAQRQQLINFFAQGNQQDLAFYKAVDAFLRDSAKFPFSNSVASSILELKHYDRTGLQRLRQTLDSSGCTELRRWGWKDADLRTLIDGYMGKGSLDAFFANEGPEMMQRQYRAYNEWNSYWQKNTPRQYYPAQ